MNIAAVVGVVSGHGHSIDMHHKNQPNNSYVASVV